MLIVTLLVGVALYRHFKVRQTPGQSVTVHREPDPQPGPGPESKPERGLEPIFLKRYQPVISKDINKQEATHLKQR